MVRVKSPAVFNALWCPTLCITAGLVSAVTRPEIVLLAESTLSIANIRHLKIAEVTVTENIAVVDIGNHVNI